MQECVVNAWCVVNLPMWDHLIVWITCPSNSRNILCHWLQTRFLLVSLCCFKITMCQRSVWPHHIWRLMGAHRWGKYTSHWHNVGGRRDNDNCIRRKLMMTVLLRFTASEPDGNVICFAGLEKFEFRPDDGTRANVKRSPKLLENALNADPSNSCGDISVKTTKPSGWQRRGSQWNHQSH